jgi:outer membrane immunogenic protein
VKKLLLIAAAFAAVIAPAIAAENPARVYKRARPVVVAAPVYSWTGWYGGFNVSGTWSDDPFNLSTTNVHLCGFVCGGPGPLGTALASAQGTTGAFSGRTNGFIGGGQLGYNWQFAKSWVAGFEADIQGIGDGRSEVVGGTAIDVFGSSIATSMTLTKEVDYLGTVRGRLGWLASPTLLAYGTGGLAYGGVKASTSIFQTIAPPPGNVVPNFASSSGISQTRTGWTAGGGFEWMLDPHWSAKVEYLYYDLGRVTYNGLLAAGFMFPPAGETTYFTNNVQSTTRFNGNIVRVGLNYQFH